ncbi:MAG: hypothetical protein K0R15_2129 [Clostridiales bacterium]|jgi:TrmH family RNA methyltransferase|nr:hypothetical protein [Clostridiales bacterium]
MEEQSINLINVNRKNVEIAGLKHEVIKQAVTLLKENKSGNSSLFLTEGIWAHQKIYDNKLRIEAFIVCEEYIFSEEAKILLDKILEVAERTYVVSNKVFAKVTQLDGPDGFVSICEFPKYELDDIELKENSLITILDGLETPGNIGTICRTSDGAEVDAIIVCNRKARITNSKTIKGSMGACFNKKIVDTDVETLIEWLQKNNFRIMLTDTRATKSYFDIDYTGRVAIVAGNERYGITRTWYNIDTELISIPMLGQCDSLNVAVSTSIILYEASMKQKGLKK